MKRLSPLAFLLAPACVAAPPVAVAPPPVRPTFATQGLERVMGQDATALATLFGRPDAEFREGPAVKLQYRGDICVLDAYLYPKGREAARVTHLDARQPDGAPIDRASCVAARTRRTATK